MNDQTTYTITWRDRLIGPTRREDGSVSDLERNNVQAEDEPQAREVFEAFYGHRDYEIVSVAPYDPTFERTWGRK